MRARRVLAATLVLSLVVHVAFTLLARRRRDDARRHAADGDAHRVAAAAQAFDRRAGGAETEAPAHVAGRRRAAPVEAPPAPPAETSAAASPDERAAGAGSDDADAAADAVVIPGAATGQKTLPPRVDLAYKVFYGTRGFLIGDAVYRFEHANNRYRITTIGEARGLAALVLRGQGKLESRGLITDDGLQPLSLRVERGGPDRVETAVFDWEAGIVTMHDNKTAPLDLPTFDPLSLMWQYYFTPPTRKRRHRDRRHAAPPLPLHAHARGDGDRSSGSRARSTPSAGIAAATTARPTRTSGSRRRCATFRSRCASPTPIRGTDRGAARRDPRRRERDGRGRRRAAACRAARTTRRAPTRRTCPDIVHPRPAETFPTMTGQ